MVVVMDGHHIAILIPIVMVMVVVNDAFIPVIFDIRNAIAFTSVMGLGGSRNETHA